MILIDHDRREAPPCKNLSSELGPKAKAQNLRPESKGTQVLLPEKLEAWKT